MPDDSFQDAYLASLYDVLEQHGGPDERFYLELAHAAPRVLDIGCGTGLLLAELREGGHTGRLVGLDPADGMIARARRYERVEWRHGYLPEQGFDGEFDLAYMTGHAFQVLLEDEGTLELLEAVRRALAPGGRFAFETRNPLARAWERWSDREPSTALDEAGRTVRVRHEVHAVHEQPTATTVSFTETFTVEGRATALVSHSTLRFCTAAWLDRLLGAAGLAVVGRYGDWDRRPFTDDAREIVTVAAPA